MPRRRRKGHIAEWHDETMDGTIRGDDGAMYLVRCSNIVTTGMLPYSGRYVTFVPGPHERPGKQDHEAYEVEIVGNSILIGVSPPRPTRKTVSRILSKLKEGIDQRGGTASQDALWDGIAVVERYPEARTNLEQIANAFGFCLLPNSLYIVAYADPEAYLVDGGGIFGSWFRGTVPFKRRSGREVSLGSYVTLGEC